MTYLMSFHGNLGIWELGIYPSLLFSYTVLCVGTRKVIYCNYILRLSGYLGGLAIGISDGL